MSDTQSFTDRLRDILRQSNVPMYRLTEGRLSKRAMYDFMQGGSLRSDKLDILLELIGASDLKLPSPRTIRNNFNRQTDRPVPAPKQDK